MSTRSPFQSEALSGFIAVGGRRADLALDDGLAGDAGGPGLALLLGVLLGGEGVLRAAGADAVGVGGRVGVDELAGLADGDGLALGVVDGGGVGGAGVALAALHVGVLADAAGAPLLALAVAVVVGEHAGGLGVSVVALGALVVAGGRAAAREAEADGAVGEGGALGLVLGVGEEAAAAGDAGAVSGLGALLVDALAEAAALPRGAALLVGVGRERAVGAVLAGLVGGLGADDV